MPPHQERVIVEESDLRDRVQKLAAFISGDVFKTLSDDERVRLRLQLSFMAGYLTVLSERIAAF